MMKHFISPNFGSEKLDAPSYTDLVDIFEDSWRGFVFHPAVKLFSLPYGDVAAMTLVSSYFEALWIYRTGTDSDGRSKEFFVKGFQNCFKSANDGIEIAAAAIYRHIRCGLAHTGMLSRKVNFSREGASAFYLTYPKNKDGSLNMKGELASIVVNPVQMCEAAQKHFETYVAALRKREDDELCKNFESAVQRLWGIGEGDNIVALTEEQFRGGA